MRRAVDVRALPVHAKPNPQPGAKWKRIEILLLVNALAAFASWLGSLPCEALDIVHWLSPRRSTRKLYAVLRLGRETLVRSWSIEPISRWLERLIFLPPTTPAQMQVPV